jgi:hypothetical protein
MFSFKKWQLEKSKKKAYQFPMSRFETWIADDLKHRQVILEPIDSVLHEVGHFTRTDRVRKRLLQLVHCAPIILNFFAYFLGVQAHKWPFQPLVLFDLEVVECEPQLVERIFQRDDLLKHWILTDLKTEQLLFAVQLFKFDFVVFDQFAHFGQGVHVLGCIRNVTILLLLIQNNIKAIERISSSNLNLTKSS